MNIIAELKDAWGWIGLRPIQLIVENDFGNLIIEDEDGCYWRLCPEELSCSVVAASRHDLERLFSDQEFLQDWHMHHLVEQAREAYGPLPADRKYCLKIPAVLSGQYVVENFGTITLRELISVSGDLAHQIKDLPEGSQVKLKVV
jgi:hypothetical protein